MLRLDSFHSVGSENGLDSGRIQFNDKTSSVGQESNLKANM